MKIYWLHSDIVQLLMELYNQVYYIMYNKYSMKLKLQLFSLALHKGNT